MTIPNGSNFPAAVDTDQNLFLVHDSLRVRLAEDYNPGDTKIFIAGDSETINRFPPTGLITLTEQCSDAEERAISFYYSSRTISTFEGLELLPEFKDVAKPKGVTNVTQNVMDRHHNSIKDAAIAIQHHAGRRGEVSQRPLEGTLEARTNYLRNLVLAPKAWFSVDKNVGLVPMVITVTDLSFRLGTDGTSHSVTHIWDFGDNSGPSIVTIVEETTVPSGLTNVLVEQDLSGPTLQKTYTKPGIYDVSLTVKNDFGSDTVVFPGLINARIPAPDQAVVNFIPRTGQTLTPGSPSGGPYTTPPVLRSPINTLIDMSVTLGLNPSTGKSYGGETLDGSNTPIDPITAYTWSLADDLQHNNSPLARASYSIGGVYDMVLRTDTTYGAYRITTYPNCLDIVEKYNLWLWTFNDQSHTHSYEFGLVSETFKTASPASLLVGYNDSFLTGAVNETQQKREFRKNNGFAARSSVPSGLGGTGLLYWASGRNSTDSPSVENVLFSEFNGFTGTYTSQATVFRPWNWVGLSSPNNVYFLLGGITGSQAAGTSPTNQNKTTLSLADFSVATTTLASSNYKNGAGELTNNAVTYDGSGSPLQGNMSVYRSCWRADTGYLLRNSGVGNFFRIVSFYKTTGNTSDPFLNLTKLPDMEGPAKVEGQLVPLQPGVFFFNNSGSVAAYNPTSGVWETGGPGVNSAAFRSFQDSNVVGFDDPSNTLLAASDGQQVVYLSYDYSPAAFTKFNVTDLTFTKVVGRPAGTQWQMCIF